MPITPAKTKAHLFYCLDDRTEHLIITHEYEPIYSNDLLRILNKVGPTGFLFKFHLGNDLFFTRVIGKSASYRYSLLDLRSFEGRKLCNNPKTLLEELTAEAVPSYRFDEWLIVCKDISNKYGLEHLNNNK